MNNIEKGKNLLDNLSPKTIFLSEKIVNPKRDWNILLIIFSIFIIIAIGFDLYMYRGIASGDMYISVNKSEFAVENLKTSDLQKILENFEAKKSIMMTLKLKNLVDPSL